MRETFDEQHEQSADLAPGIERRGPCRVCGKATLSATLSEYGQRCFACYEAYCGEVALRAPELVDRVVGPNRWAHALKKREQLGEPLTITQREMWRYALGEPPLFSKAKTESQA